MRLIALALCVLAAAFAPVPTQANGDVPLPFHGVFTREGQAVFTPPATLHEYGTATGTATRLGLFTAASVDVIDTVTSTGTGTFDLTAANQDQLFTTTTGQQDEFIPPNIARATLHATIVGGTGRFGAATGAFTIHITNEIDFASATSTGFGWFEGHINLNK